MRQGVDTISAFESDPLFCAPPPALEGTIADIEAAFGRHNVEWAGIRTMESFVTKLRGARASRRRRAGPGAANPSSLTMSDVRSAAAAMLAAFAPGDGAGDAMRGAEDAPGGAAK